MSRINRSILVSATALALSSTALSAGHVVNWNVSNIAVGPAVDDDPLTPAPESGASVIYQNPPTNTETNGQIVYTAPEADTPGLLADNTPFVAGGEAYDGCLRASSGTTCDGDFRSGKRFKQQVTKTGPIDLVFDVEDDGEPGSTVLRSFHRLINVTGQAIKSFTVELGFGVGDAFTRSTSGDGLGFAPNLQLGPDKVTAFSQYPFGLFGDADGNPNFTLDGFYDDARSGFNLDIGEDLLASDGFYGIYDQLFGNWLSQEDAPAGLLWDDDGDPATDALVMSWFDELSGQWETLRSIDPVTGEAISILSTPEYDADPQGVADFLGLALGDLEQGPIEDLANLNLNYGILLEDGFFDNQFTDFTLRVTTHPAPVPLPPAAPLLAAGIGLVALMRRRAAARA